jgi:hypothetical protein
MNPKVNEIKGDVEHLIEYGEVIKKKAAPSRMPS